MPAVVPFVVAAASAASAVSGLMGVFQGGKLMPKGGPQPAGMQPPTPADANKDAQAQIDKKRRMSLLSGGNTDVTRGSGVVNSSSVGTKTLVGQ